MTHLRIIAVLPTREYRLELEFTDGFRGEVDLHDDIVGKGGVFRQLESPDFFRRVCVDADAGTIVWPNDVDLCPDVLYNRATQLSPAKRPANMTGNAGAA